MPSDITKSSAIHNAWPPPPIISEWELSIIDPIIKTNDRRKVFVEIGGFRGGSAYHFAQLMEPGATIITVDLPEGVGGGNTSPKGMAETLADLKKVFQELKDQGFDAHLIIGNSKDQKIIDRVNTILDKRKIDVLFIDGDHSITGASTDFVNYGKMVEGLAVFHDCGQRWGCPDFSAENHAYMNATNGIFNSIGVNRRTVVVQEDYGTGIIWVD